MKKFAGYALVLVFLLSFCDNSTTSTPSTTTSQATPSSVATPESSAPTSTPTASPSAEPATPEPTPTQAQAQSNSGVQVQLAALLIKGRAPKTDYTRSQFGSAWADVDRNGCDTRNDILARDLTDITYRSGTGDCVVESGNFFDPYSGDSFAFVKSSSGSTIEIDHIVSLSDAWQKGAQQWDSATRKQFANDPLNLVSTSRSINRSKSDGDAATWLPPNKSIRCAFIARQVAVKSAYLLWVTQAEFNAMKNILDTCPSQPLANSETLR